MEETACCLRVKSLYFLTVTQRKSKSKVKLNFGLSPDLGFAQPASHPTLVWRSRSGEPLRICG